jgi:two-component system chemotaxis sensor kinase CheA
LRNAVDHAIEPPEQRERAGKPRRATLALSVTQLGGSRVQITLADDGAGIDLQHVRTAAVRNGILSQAQAAQLEDGTAQALIFHSGLSTSDAVTPLSGRGLGLAIVQEHAQRLGGSVQVDSTRGRGTRFRIVVPATRATFRGILCEAAGRQFVVPATAVERVACLRADALRSVEGRIAVCIGEQVMALAHLAEVLGLVEVSAAAKPENAGLQVVVIGSGEQAVAFAVDAVIEECEVLVKPLRKPLLRIPNIAAAAVMGAGVLIPVLNPTDLLQSARRARAPAPVTPAKQAQVRLKNVLVAEDSITSRLLLKSILQSAGYAVKTAVDGAEALTMLRTHPFDLLVSDVEMPRLNGFDLTTRVRSDKKLAELPVILVTALATREDKERGVDVGANAYIVKGNFDQDNLLASVERLIG